MRSVIAAAFILCIFGVYAAYGAAGCPSIKIEGPDRVTTAGDTVVFTAFVDEIDDESSLEYFWEAEGGEIIEGQGTAAVKIQTDEDAEIDTVIAKLTLKNIEKKCDNVAFETAPIQLSIPGCPDEMGDLDENDTRARFDQFFIELQNNPTHKAYFVFYIPKSENADISNSRVRLLSNTLVSEK